MTPAFQWITSGVDAPRLDYQQLERWIVQVAASYNRIVRSLNHDYYTDIITFDDCTAGMLRGDMYISLDTVRSNAEMLGVGYDRELRRVIIHGVLHLCGINDKGPGEREIMEAAEDKALALLS